MRRFWIAEIQISDEMEDKIRSRRFVTGDQVREACVPDAYESACWDEFETDDATFDAMMARGEPAEIVAAPLRSFVVTTFNSIFLSDGTSLTSVNGTTISEGPARLPAVRRRLRREPLAS